MPTKKESTHLEDDEHVLKRADTYMGSKVFSNLPFYAFYAFENESESIMQREIYTAPGFNHIFLELLSNASDNIIRAVDEKFPLPKSGHLIEITHNKKTDTLSIKNYGEPVPILPHSKFPDKTNVEVTFGMLRTSENYDDEKIRLGVGRNGFGAKITNIYSKFFEVEVKDTIRGQHALIRWEDNMKKITMRDIAPGFDENNKSLGVKGKKSEWNESFVKVTYKPDYTKFKFSDEKINHFTQDILNIFKRIAFDIAFSTRIPISFSEGSDKYSFKFNSLDHFIPFYYPEFLKEETSFPIIYYKSDFNIEKKKGSDIIMCKALKDSFKIIEDKTSPKLIKLSSYTDIKLGVEVFITKNINNTDKNSISFVNGLFVDSGNHISEIIDKTFIPKIISSLPQSISKGAKKLEVKIKPSDIKKYFTFIINMFVPNPAFGGQTKSQLVEPDIKIENLDKDEFTDILKKKAWKDLLDEIKDKLIDKNDDKLKTSDAHSKARAIKVKDACEANFAGNPKYVEDCTLWLTEGDSAQKYVDTRIKFLTGKRNFNGVYALRGKLINASKAAISVLSKNEEYNDFKALMNLQEKATFKDKEDIRNKLKYGKIMIAADSDADGIHIRMLILNLIAEKWPDLIRLGCVAYISTPIVRALDKKTNKSIYRFYSDTAYEKWSQTYPDEVKKYNIKHYKGLATSKDIDVAEDVYTAPLVTIVYDDTLKGSLNLAFGATQADARKEWILDWKSKFGSDYEPEVTFESISQLAEKNYASFKKDLDTFQSKFLIDKRDGSNIIETDLGGFSYYTLSRAIPSLYDGFKRSQRQIFWTCLNKWNYSFKEQSTTKVTKLSGDILEKVNYAHGQVSLEDAIINMAKNYPGSNNINVLFPDGQFGSRINDKKTAPRYVSVCLSEYIPYIFKKEIVELVPRRLVEGDLVESEWLPCDIPLHLINGTRGIATGWSTNILPYNPVEIIKWYIEVLKTNSFKEIFRGIPYFRYYKGSVEVDGKSVIIRGSYKILKDYNNSSKGVDIEIFDVPPGTYANEYENYLKELINNKRLKNYANNTEDNNLKFILYNFIENSKYDLEDKNNLDLIKKESLSNINLIDENDIPNKFDDVTEIMLFHIIKMIEIYEKYKNSELEKIQSKITYNDERRKLIEAIITEKLKVYKRPIDDIHKDIAKLKLNKEIFEVLKMKDCTKEEIERLIDLIKSLEDEYKKLFNTDHRDIYRERLEKFLKFIEKDF